MADQALLLQALRSFAAAMKRSYDVTEMCYELCDRTVDVLSATGAGVSVVDETEVLRFVTATDERILSIEEIQESSQTGPCVTAYQTRQPVPVSDINAHPNGPPTGSGRKNFSSGPWWVFPSSMMAAASEPSTSTTQIPGSGRKMIWT